MAALAGGPLIGALSDRRVGAAAALLAVLASMWLAAGQRRGDR